MEDTATARSLDFLTVLSRGDANVSKALLKNADDTLVDAISECCLQIVNGTVKIEHESARRKLEELQPILQQLAEKSYSRKEKRELLLGKGLRVLEICLPPALHMARRMYLISEERLRNLDVARGRASIPFDDILRDTDLNSRNKIFALADVHE
ncbi:hypothetical protein RvY_02354 [Ramazzottius varieornatus]|uniref:Uncharacterized protein n=1 Tax=Ramazzottius varieornatus TaxID=947166 RepID=A0A1D1UQB5_RAMVA|nr:hypothetical protein RvY_02354 [Ramazzottius varieornatus]